MPRSQISSDAAQERREAILAAGLELFSERGFHGTSVPRVAEQAEVGTGTIYRYFESKEALVNAIYQQQKISLSTFVLSRFPLDEPVREQFHVLWQRLVTWATRNPSAFRFLEMHHHAPYLDSDSVRLEDRVLEQSVQFYRLGVEQQVLKDAAPSVLIALVWGAFVGLMKAEWSGHVRLDAPAIQLAEDCCWEAIRR